MRPDPVAVARPIEVFVRLTRRSDVPTEEYYADIARDPLARLVKTADLAADPAPHRVAQLDVPTRERLATKYDHALRRLGVDRTVTDELHAPAGEQPISVTAAGEDQGTHP